MNALEEIRKMKGEGRSDEEIISALKQQGISPKEINQAINQAHIKDAVDDSSKKYEDVFDTPSQSSPGNQEDIFPQENPPSPSDNNEYVPQPNEAFESNAAQQSNQFQSSPQQEYYSPQASYQENTQYTQQYDSNEYGGGDYGGYYQGTPETSTDMLIDISEQVFDEKMGAVMKKIDDLEEFKTLAQTKIEYLSERVKKLDALMDKLQIAILEKVGSYGKNLESVKKEMSIMQDSFRKTLDPLLKIAEEDHKKSSNQKTNTHNKS